MRPMNKSHTTATIVGAISLLVGSVAGYLINERVRTS